MGPFQCAVPYLQGVQVDFDPLQWQQKTETKYDLSLDEIHFGNPVLLEKLIATHFGKRKKTVLNFLKPLQTVYKKYLSKFYH